MTSFGILIYSVILGAICAIISFNVLKKQETPAKIEAEMKEILLSLFLYAEKQGWTGEAKIAYVAHKVYDYIPGKHLESTLNGKHLLEYIQNVYEEAKRIDSK